MTIEVPPGFDWRHPDYLQVFRLRERRLRWLRSNPDELEHLKAFYRENVAQFITDWGCTFDPRNIERDLPALVPFVLFPRQVEWVDWLIDSWRKSRPGVTPKSRESGLSWLSIAAACSLCLFHDGMTIGFGSRKEEYVDKIDAPKSLFWKARKFMTTLPLEFRGGFRLADSPYMRIVFRRNGSIITGEAGDNIGRGDRASLYIVDEAAYLEHPDIVDAALSQTTNCRIDVSTPNGTGNPFHRKAIDWPSERVFRFHWHDDPRKDEAWYEKQKSEHDPVTIAQELDIDFAASVEGVLIPSAWVVAAIDAHVKLGIHEPTGLKAGALDVADEGKDKNAFCGAHGFLIECLEEWSGKGDDIFATVQRAFDTADEHGYDTFVYDADGLGAGVRGDARVVNQNRRDQSRKEKSVFAFRGSAPVQDPDSEIVEGRLNKDFFANLKAQAWWSLRMRFQKTHRAVCEGAFVSADEIISIPSALKLRDKLCMELSQPTFRPNAVGKIVIDKAPEGSRSPNLADAVMMRFAPSEARVVITPRMLAMSSRPGVHKARFAW